jgi:hypothetical protein
MAEAELVVDAADGVYQIARGATTSILETMFFSAVTGWTGISN